MYWVLLFIATHASAVRIPGEIPHSDKLVHFSAFGILAFLCWRFAQAWRSIGDRFVWGAGAVLIAYAAVDEYLQQFVGRHTDVLDFGADTAGIVSVLTVLELVRRRRQRT